MLKALLKSGGIVLGLLLVSLGIAVTGVIHPVIPVILVLMVMWVLIALIIKG